MVVEYSNLIKTKTYYQNSLLKNSYLRDHSINNSINNAMGVSDQKGLSKVKSSDCMRHPNMLAKYTSNAFSSNNYNALSDLPHIDRKMNSKTRLETLRSKSPKKQLDFKRIEKTTFSARGKQNFKLSSKLLSPGFRRHNEGEAMQV